MLCERNDDVTYYPLFIACIATCEKVSPHELAVVSMQCAIREGNSLAFWKRKSKSVSNWCNEKGVSEYGSTSHSTLYRSFRGWPFQAECTQIYNNETVSLNFTINRKFNLYRNTKHKQNVLNLKL